MSEVNTVILVQDIVISPKIHCEVSAQRWGGGGNKQRYYEKICKPMRNVIDMLF